MKTDTERVEYIVPGKDYVYLLDQFELAMPKEQVDRIVEKHNAGEHLKDIAKSEQRHIVEVVVALLHQSVVGGRNYNRGKKRLTRQVAKLI